MIFRDVSLIVELILVDGSRDPLNDSENFAWGICNR